MKYGILEEMAIYSEKRLYQKKLWPQVLRYLQGPKTLQERLMVLEQTSPARFPKPRRYETGRTDANFYRLVCRRTNGPKDLTGKIGEFECD
ncbi:hypothetical protein [Zunongwangia sp. H14]|uniref:hypothetical protein n=1 Tax=Zunongwangia sp. H14 TaxID=3240792 RepID=UPI00356615A9